ncbi:MAG: class I SAM-dependent methyltransferase [Flavobacteriaceae bacterium]|nr:class I SAM-dependent methyltransferase [Flavobacteriaceae bacterium]
MEIINPKIMDYAEMHTTPEPELLTDLRRETWLKVVNPRMLSGSYQGRLIALISKLIRPKNILEIGTFTGYATLCLAEGLLENGQIITIDQNEELVDIQQKYFTKSKYAFQINALLGEAIALISNLDMTFDLIFIDADKQNYSAYFDLVIEKLNIGGIILTDNVLWNGKVIENTNPNDMDTLAIQAYNKKVQSDTRVETILLPIRDGISITRKIS